MPINLHSTTTDRIHSTDDDAELEKSTNTISINFCYYNWQENYVKSFIQVISSIEEGKWCGLFLTPKFHNSIVYWNPPIATKLTQEYSRTINDRSTVSARVRVTFSQYSDFISHITA